MLGGSCGWLLLFVFCAGASAGKQYQPSHADFEADEAFIQEMLNPNNKVPDKVSNVTAEDFSRYFREGKPLIVTDMITNWAMKDWTCDSVSKDFAEEPVIVWSYMDGSKHKKFHKLKDIEKWQAASMKQPKATTKDTEAPTKLSYHWYPVQMGVPEDQEPEPLSRQEDDYHSTLASVKARKKIKESYDVPYFVERNHMNMQFTKERMEFFLGMKGSGAAVHADAVCEAIFSVQLAGVKRWRLSPLPPYKHATQQRSVDSQGGKGRMWSPTYVFDLLPGEAIFFPPSFMHETQCVSDECSLSASLQIRYPFPVGHIRDFSKRLLNSVRGTGFGAERCRRKCPFALSTGRPLSRDTRMV
eukprot:TRINITY_DN1942_c0_g2_i2.p1 TRINITY_DN1942_c0_g2~~TRINITY_DN1942_c0_g2_i2.p1  ORF type:complete len:357 (+),score=97.52 TRINITY_DN1942_c0_g2_i2:223-1293(+)